MQKTNQALHKLLVTPISLFPKSRSTRYLGIDQVKNHDIPFMKDYLLLIDKLALIDFNTYVKWKNLYVKKFQIKPYSATYPTPLPYPNYIFTVKLFGQSTSMNLQYLPAISEGIEINFNMFFEEFSLGKYMVEIPSDSWIVILYLIKLEKYDKIVL